MTLLIALTVGTLFAMGTFLALRNDLVKIILGVSILAQAANLYLIAMGGISEGTGDLVPVLTTSEAPFPQTADPLVQALVLTAIVISFGMTAFMLVLAYRAFEENGTMDVREWEQ